MEISITFFMYAYRYRCWSKHMQWNNELEIGFATGKYNCFVNPLLLMFTSFIIMVGNNVL